MLTVVGGTYQEVCLEPEWNQLFGSAMRAAAAVSAICSQGGGETELYTWVADRERATAELFATNFGLRNTLHERSDAIQFQYDHCLSVPRIFPEPVNLANIGPVSVHADNALVFGVLEDKPVSVISVEAKGTLVYDPQSGVNAIPFSKMPLSASRKAIVANQAEVEAMCQSLGCEVASDESRPKALGRALLAKEGVDVVVLKNGAEGAFVITDLDTHHVCSHKTDRVFKIGSGDVFSAVFAAYYGELDGDPVEAATRASAAVAFYCNRGGLASLPIPADPSLLVDPGISTHEVPSVQASNRARVYIAGPLFSFPQRWFIQEVRRCLTQQGVDNFSPFHQVGLAKEPLHQTEMNRVAKLDLDGLEGCDSVFAILDGLDAGTLFEIGYAASKGIPVIAFAQCVDDRDLLMIEGNPMCRVIRDFPTAIYHAAWRALEAS